MFFTFLFRVKKLEGRFIQSPITKVVGYSTSKIELTPTTCSITTSSIVINNTNLKKKVQRGNYEGCIWRWS